MKRTLPEPEPTSDAASGNRYLLCGTYPDDTDDLSGRVFTPASSEGEEVMNVLFNEVVDTMDRSELMQMFTGLYDFQAEEKDGKILSKADLKRKRIFQGQFKRTFPTLAAYEDLAVLGTLEDWDPKLREPVVVCYVNYEF